MKLFELNEILNKKFPKEYACEWDNDGLMCATNMNSQVKKVLCTLDVTKNAIDYAKENGYDTIISHHPLIFNPLNAITPENHVASKTIYALKNEINIFSFHTRFDAMPGGINDLLSMQLGLLNVSCFGEDEMGRVGELARPMNPELFCKFVKDVLGCDHISFLESDNEVKTVAVLGGAGKSYIKAAIEAGADTFVTGELSYSSLNEAKEMGITLVEAGHYFTENAACKFFKELLDEHGIENGYFASYNIKTI